MLETKFFKAEEAGQGVTRIFGLSNESCYLVEGNNKALLIDTTTGIGNIKEFCSRLTELPITVVNTHGHQDHAGGNFVFEEIYIHEKDIELMYDLGHSKVRIDHMNSRFQILSDKESVILEDGDVSEVKTIRCHPLREGDIFDLGGRFLEVIETPGHTKGSVSFFDRENRYFFSGDSCNSHTLLIPGHSTTVEEFKETLIKMKGLMESFDVYFTCHGRGELPKSCIDDVLECCEEILAGRNDGVPFNLHGYPAISARSFIRPGLLKDGKSGNVVYTKDLIYKKEK
jgi:glyoxylase-like metal-dependent hydrolase (beta-lactamase superfamily II)